MKALSLLIKPASGNCNMRCKYCFYTDVMDSREAKNRGIMSQDIAEAIIEKALSETSEYCVFGFQGGEPTLAGLTFFRNFTAFVKKNNKKQIHISYTLQTNGINLGAEWAAFFKENGFLIGLSVDANPETHDFLRPDAAGKSTHSRCLKAAKLLGTHGVDFNILSVVTRHLASHPEKAYRFYKRHGFRYIQFIPCLDPMDGNNNSTGYAPDAEAYGFFLCRIFDLWYADYKKGEFYSIRAFDNYIRMLAGYPPENCAMSGKCNAYALVEADGSVYPCDFYAVDRYLLGNVRLDSFTEMLNGETAASFAAPSMQPDPSCLKCTYGFICRGGCRRDREPLHGDILSLNRYCVAYKAFFRHSLPRMQEIVRRLASNMRGTHS